MYEGVYKIFAVHYRVGCGDHSIVGRVVLDAGADGFAMLDEAYLVCYTLDVTMTIVASVAHY